MTGSEPAGCCGTSCCNTISRLSEHVAGRDGYQYIVTNTDLYRAELTLAILFPKFRITRSNRERRIVRDVWTKTHLVRDKKYQVWKFKTARAAKKKFLELEHRRQAENNGTRQHVAELQRRFRAGDLAAAVELGLDY